MRAHSTKFPLPDGNSMAFTFFFFLPPLQIYHFCHSNGKQDTFHCPYGTIFNEYLGTCDHDEAVYCRGGDGYKAPPAPHKHQASYHETGGEKALRKKISASKSKGKYMCCLPFFLQKLLFFSSPRRLPRERRLPQEEGLLAGTISPAR